MAGVQELLCMLGREFPQNGHRKRKKADNYAGVRVDSLPQACYNSCVGEAIINVELNEQNHADAHLAYE